MCVDCRSIAESKKLEQRDKDDIERDRKEREEFAEMATEAGANVLTPEQAAAEEMAGRILSRRRLLPFVKRFMPSYQAGWVHKDICAHLEKFSEDVANKRSPRLMIFQPPRSGKSELASRNFPAWHLGKYPEHEVIATSYSGSLALKFSRKVRSLLREPGYAELFPSTKLDPDTQSVEFWQTTAGGAYMAAGVSGPLTGNGMHIGIIDDPVKNREEAESQNTRQSIKEWYTSTFYTRLAPGAGILVILTRWHHDDLAGWLLEEEKNGGDKWDVIIYPAIAEHDEKYRRKGEALHPERYDHEALSRIRRAVGPRDWQALYQQQPTAAEGEYFRKDWFRYYGADERPPLKELVTYSAWDLAIGQREANDYSVGVTIGVDRQERVWVLDLVRGRWDSLELCDIILDTWRSWKPQRVGIERGQISMAIGPLLEQRIKERKDWGFPYDPDGLKTGKADKQVRARPIQGRIRQGMVIFPRDADWLGSFENELLAFPSGVHDDQVDALAWCGQMMKMFSTVPEEKEKSVSWRDKLPQLMRKNSSNANNSSAMDA
ncbi:MAG: phage terminase large subunit [Cellvibrionaceae bacterium]